MKKITLLTCLLAASIMQGQYHAVEWTTIGANPRGLNGDPEQTAGILTPLGWTVNSAPGATNWSSAGTIPFPFQFNGNTQNTYYVHPSGLVTLGSQPTSAPPTTPASLPNTGLPDNTIAVWGLNLSGPNDNILTQTFGTAPYRQHWIMWSSASYTTGTHWAYWSVVFEESTNNIYVVDQRTYAQSNVNVSLIVGVQTNSTTAVSTSNSPVSSVNLATSGNGDNPSDNKVYAFVPLSAQPTLDAAGQIISNTDFIQVNNPTALAGEIVNYGTAGITSMKVNYKINNGATQTANITNLNIASGARAAFSIPNAINFTSTGTFNYKVWFDEINNNPEERHVNDTLYKTMSGVSNLATRYPLYENFSSSTCAPCTPANVNIHNIFNQNPGEYVSIKYQMSWPGTGDPYYTLEGGTRRTYYAVNSVPNCVVDGNYWQGNGSSLTQGIFDGAQNEVSFVELEASYYVDGKRICVDVVVTPYADIPANDLRLHIGIKEFTTTQNVKTNGETIFRDVMKKMLPNANGSPVPPLVNGTPVTISQCFTFQGEFRLPGNAQSPIDHSIEHSVEDFNDLGAVAWLQADGSKTIYNAAEAAKVVGIDDFDPISHNLRVYPNPAVDLAYISVDMDRAETAAITMVNVLGQTVYNKTASLESGTNMVELPVSSFTAGVYFVNITISGQTQTVKLTVQ